MWGGSFRLKTTGRLRDTFERSKTAGLAEFADDGGDVALFRIDKIIEMAHLGRGDLAAQFGKYGAKLRKFLEGGLADDGHGVVGRKVVTVVFQNDEMQRVDDAICGVARDNVNLMIL